MVDLISAIQKIEAFSKAQAGVFSLSDIKNIFGVISRDKLFRYIGILEQKEILFRVKRGFYITKVFDPYVLSQRIAPDSYISCATVLAKEMIIGTIPQKIITAVKTGPGRVYKNDIITVKHFKITPELYFGYTNEGGVQFAVKEKAFIDTLYYYTKGMKLFFDIYSDINYDLLDKEIILNYLGKYKNKRFISFVRNLLNGNF